MNNNLKEAFEQVRAEQEIKDKTREFLRVRTRGYTVKTRTHYRSWIPAAICLCLLLFGARWLYFVPTATISIDINPSLELGVNRFDRVISVGGYNEDGKELENTLDLKFLDYEEAVEQILEDERITELLSQDAVMAIAVVGPEGNQTERILSDMETCTKDQENAYCYQTKKEDVEAAHEQGLSYGKYQAFLELQELDPGVTPEQVQGMSMREIRDRIEALSQEQETEVTEEETHLKGKENGNGNGNGSGNGKKKNKEN